MGKIYDEFAEELDKIAHKYQSRPEKELDVLLYIALQREELVATVYRATFIQRNIERLNVPHEAKQAIRHALIWIWKDEDMHTVYTRGALLKSSVFRHKINVYINQFNGYIGGWAGSTIQHLRWKQSPLAVSLAKTIVFFGKISGKISKELHKELKFSSFKHFCGFNIDAEQTARICWERILLLAKNDARFTQKHLNDFQKIIFDELQHERIFQLVFDHLNESDEFNADASAEKLIAAIGNVSPYFLPVNNRSVTVHPVGKGEPVHCCKNESLLDKYDYFQEELAKTSLKNELLETANRLGLQLQELIVTVKVAFSMGYSKTDVSPITDPLLLARLVDFLNEIGIEKIKVIEVDSIYRNFYDNRSIDSLADYFGFTSSKYQVINASEDTVPHNFSRGIGTYGISQSWKDAHFRINFAKLRSHPVEMALLSVNNLEWLTGELNEFVFANRIVNRSTINAMLLDDFPPEFNVVDAYDAIPDGLIGVMGCKHPVSPKRFYFGKDPVSIDLVIHRQLGTKALPEKSSLSNAMHWFGIESFEPTIVGEDSPITPWKSPTRNFFWSVLSLSAFPVYQFFSKKGLLFVPKMDTKAFPYLKRPNLWVRFVRSFNRRITNLPH